ncbi:MAG: hypothetical protein HEQ19_11675 [Gloeotrichia echinulata CP02]
MIVIGHLSLVICHWSFVICHLSFVIGHWSLDLLHKSKKKEPLPAFDLPQSLPFPPAGRGCFQQ